jgi:hypothetical protein
MSHSDTIQRQLWVARKEMQQIRDMANGVIGEEELSTRCLLCEVSDGPNNLNQDVSELRDDHIHIC